MSKALDQQTSQKAFEKIISNLYLLELEINKLPDAGPFKRLIEINNELQEDFLTHVESYFNYVKDSIEEIHRTSEAMQDPFDKL